jgi:hypothetical protein
VERKATSWDSLKMILSRYKHLSWETGYPAVAPYTRYLSDTSKLYLVDAQNY